MDNDEVKAALNRFRTVRVARYDMSQYNKDLLTLAAAYAKEHPPDEGELITPEWLLANGFNYCKDPDPQAEHYLEYRDADSGERLLLLYHNADGTFSDEEIPWPYDLHARCQVRGLLRELTR